MSAANTLKVFISYAHEDIAYLKEFQKHLSLLEREEIIEEWNDDSIMPGQNWDETIKSKIEESDIIVFLVSSDFIASHYIHEIEIKKVIERCEKGECILLPVVIRTCDFSSLSISKYQALPKGAKPVSTWEDKDAAWLDVIKQIRQLTENFKLKKDNQNQENHNTNNTQNISTSNDETSDKGEIKQTITELTDKNKGINTLFKNRPYLYLFEQAFEGDLQPHKITDVTKLNKRFKTILVEAFEEDVVDKYRSHHDVVFYPTEMQFETEIKCLEVRFGTTYHTYKVYKNDKFADEIKIDFSLPRQAYLFEAIKCNLYVVALKFEKQRIINQIEIELNESTSEEFKHFLFKISNKLIRVYGESLRDIEDRIVDNINKVIRSFGKREILQDLIRFLLYEYENYLDSGHIEHFRYILREDERSMNSFINEMYKESLVDVENYGFDIAHLEIERFYNNHQEGFREKLKFDEFFNINDYKDKIKFWKENGLKPTLKLSYKNKYFSILPKPSEIYAYNNFVYEYCEKNVNDGTNEIIGEINRISNFSIKGRKNFDLKKTTFHELKEEFIAKYKRAPLKEYLVKDEIKNLQDLKTHDIIKPIFKKEYDLVAKGAERNLKNKRLDFPKFYINLAIRPYVEYLVWLESDEFEKSYKKEIEELTEPILSRIGSDTTKTKLEEQDVEVSKGISSQKNTINSIKRKSYLFVIGIDEYQNPNFPDLGNAVLDSKNVIKVLQERYGFELIQPAIFNEDATRENIIEQMNGLCTTIHKEDNLIIYFAGHGEKHSVTNKGYWVPHDANRSISDFVPNSTIKDFIEGIVAKHIFLISDSCFSGTFLMRTRSGIDERHYKKIDESKSRWVLTSGREELVSDGMPGKGSPFANALVKVLVENKNKFISSSEIINYVTKATGSIAKQQPIGAHIENIGHEGGQMVLTLDDKFVGENINNSLKASTLSRI